MNFTSVKNISIYKIMIFFTLQCLTLGICLSCLYCSVCLHHFLNNLATSFYNIRGCTRLNTKHIYICQTKYLLPIRYFDVIKN